MIIANFFKFEAFSLLEVAPADKQDVDMKALFKE